MKITTDSVPHRTPSDGSEHGSIKKRFSTLLRKSSKETLHKTNSARSQNSIDVQDDPLPETKKDLEIRLNYHLSELDLLKKTLQAANDMIRQHQERFEILQTRSDVDMRNAMIKQERMVDIARSNRNSYVEFVSFHRRQIERIRHKRIEIELNAGVEPTLPQVYKQMWGDDEWIKLFAP